MKRKDIKKRPLADTVIAGLEPETREYREHDGNGLYLRVKPNGGKSWQLRYRQPDGKWSWIGLGPYGTGTHQYTGAQARKRAAALLAEAVEGKPLLITKREKETANRADNSFERLAREWLAGKVPGWTAGTAKRAIGSLELHVLPTFGNRHYAEITPYEWLEFFRAVQAKGIIEQANRIRQLCREIYGLARVTGRITHNPIEGLSTYMQKVPKENMAHVTLPELPALLRNMRAYQGDADIRLGLNLLALLACRPSELRCASWHEFDLDNALWTIPAARMKRRREHVIPLPKQAVELLQELHNYTGRYPLVLPGRSDTAKPRSDTVFLMALRRMGYEGRQTGHGFRHLFSTIANENGFDPNVVEAALSHVKGGVAGVYNKAQYLDQRRALMQWYADHLDKLAGGNVVQIRGIR